MQMLSIVAGIAIRRLTGLVSARLAGGHYLLRTTISADRIIDLPLDFQHQNLHGHR
jgi:hypothetical protein